MKKIILVVIVMITIAMIYVLDLQRYLNIQFILEKRNELTAYVEAHLLRSVIIFMLIYILATTFSVPGATVLSMTGGFLFGMGVGVVTVALSATSGAVFNFLFARYVFGEKLQEKYHDKLVKFNKNIEQNGKNYMLTLRLIPIFPFFLINLLAGLTNIKLNTFIWTTVIGIIPGGLFYIYAGTTLKTANAVSDILTFKTILPLVALGIIAFLPVLINKGKITDEK